MEKSPHNTTPEPTPNAADATERRNVAGVDTSHLSSDDHQTLATVIQAIVSLVLGLVFRKRE